MTWGINPAFEDIWGRDLEELYGETLSFLDTVHPDDRERIRDAFTALPDDPIDEEFRIVRPDGEIRLFCRRLNDDYLEFVHTTVEPFLPEGLADA